ncbi:type VI secretion system baseplate subunit TssK [Escherichia coli]
MTQNCCKCDLCAGRGGKRAGRSDPASMIQQSKISSPEKIRNMVSVQIPGIPLRALMVAPRQLPYHSGFSYLNSTRVASSDRNGCRRGRCTACIRQFPGSRTCNCGR